MVAFARHRLLESIVRTLRGHRCTAAGLLLVAAIAPAWAGQLRVRVIDPRGLPVANVVVVVTPAAGLPPKAAPPATAILDQQSRAFVPMVLAVRTGTSVAFPNSDAISHQVYSFSAAKRFQLPLYKGRVHPPVAFEHPGLIVLGCNIHDEMIGYIYVTDSAWFGVTDAAGMVALPDVPPGQATLEFWGPRVADPAASLTRSTLIASGPDTVEVRLNRPLRPRPEPRPQNPEWDY